MEFYDYEIKECEDVLRIIQSDMNGGHEMILLSKAQTPLFIEALENMLNNQKEKESTGYLAQVEFEKICQTIQVFVDTLSELAKLKNDIQQNGFGIECDILCSGRIKYRYED